MHPTPVVALSPADTYSVVEVIVRICQYHDTVVIVTSVAERSIAVDKGGVSVVLYKHVVVVVEDNAGEVVSQ